MTHDHGDIYEFLRAEVGVEELMRSKVQAALLTPFL
jgi:hypothetical protein